MIYLIDDNQHNQREINYNISFVDDGTFDDVLVSITKIPHSRDATNLSHLEFLKTADCILLHSTTEDYDFERQSYLSGVRTNALKIQEIISDDGEKIPLVLFSNSMGQPIFDQEKNPNFISEIKKNIFYDNLFDFLTFYRQTNKIELRILAFGKTFMANEASKLAGAVLSNLAHLKEDEVVSLTDLSTVLKSFMSLLQLSFEDEIINEIFEDLEDSPFLTKDFRNKINQITKSYYKYGKNIFPWK